MRFCDSAIAVVVAAALAILASRASAQYQPPSEKFLMTARSASTWSQGSTDVVLLDGPIRIELDRAILTARQAVVWIVPEHVAADEQARQSIQVALLGDAKVEQPQLGTKRSGDRIMVTAEVAGRVSLTADQNVARDDHDTPVYRDADAMRAPPAPPSPPPPGPAASLPGSAPPATAEAPGEPVPDPPLSAPDISKGPTTVGSSPQGRPATGPLSRPALSAAAEKLIPVAFEAGDVQTINAGDGTVAVVLSGDVILRQRRPTGDLVELLAQRGVLFSRLKSLKEVQKSGPRTGGNDQFTGAYLEGDVRIRYTPVIKPDPRAMGEQRLDARQVYYEFATDRAILVDAVIHDMNPQPPVPIIIRAKTVRQLAAGEYKAEKVQVSSSSFARPTFGVAADRIYIRAEGEGDDKRTVYDAKNATLRVFDVPVFYFPHISGVADDNGSVLRNIGIEHQSAFGTGVTTDLGMFELLGLKPPRDLDVVLRADYLSKRGPAAGVDANYEGGFVTDSDKQAWNFEGDFHSYFIYDKGSDDIGRPLPQNVSGDYRLRGYAGYEHQHFFPDGWQAQIRLNYVSDQEFLEQYFPHLFDTGLPRDVSLYLKHQQDNEALTLLYQAQPNGLVTSSDFFQNQFEVEHVPELGYRRIGDSLADDRLTSFSENTFDGLHFKHTRSSLAQEGFIYVSPGIPSLGTTGTTDKDVYRADFREELDYPIQAGQFKLVPYVLGRYTVYSDSPAGGAKNRFLGALGAKINTSFWKVDDAAQSDLFDIHRVRHVIEPEVNLFTSAETVHRNDVYLYDYQVDAVNDISAAQFALHQRWQTYRGGPGRWRSVDFLTLDVEADLYAHQPTRQQLNPFGFRGLFFPSEPEISVARNAINANLQWRISDNTVILADAQENMDERRLATAAVGVVVRRDVSLDYYVGMRYIDQLKSNITTVAVDYQISSKYALSFSQSADLGLGKDVQTVFAVTRRFDNCFLVFQAYKDETTGQSGVGINIVPNGSAYGANSMTLRNSLGNTSR